jgi:hypothetical protein
MVNHNHFHRLLVLARLRRIAVELLNHDALHDAGSVGLTQHPGSYRNSISENSAPLAVQVNENSPPCDGNDSACVTGPVLT